MKTGLFVVFLVLATAVGGAAYYTKYSAAEPKATYRTAVVKRDDLLSTISATGTVQPEEVVDVGAQVVGRIKNLGNDPSDPTGKKTIDYRSEVREGTVLANIDPAVYDAQVKQAEAALVRANADLVQMDAKLVQAKAEYERAAKLLPTNSIARADYDVAVANFKAAQANVGVSKAMIRQSEAALGLARTNLEYTVIKSPVEGVIIDRRVNVGQTVVASLNAPSLFLIAKDLRRIQVWASVNEADIGRIHLNMPVRFTVDAFPGEWFHGTVAQIRLNATMTQNVVTYTVVVATDNQDGKLLPYLTSNLQFEIEQHRNVLLVPNAALRWRPRAEQMLPELRETLLSAGPGKASATQTETSAKPSGAAAGQKPAQGREDLGRLWVQDGSYVRPVEVQVGATDGSVTMVSGNDVKEGMEVVIGEARKENLADRETTNPFAPKLFRGNTRNKTQS